MRLIERFRNLDLVGALQKQVTTLQHSLMDVLSATTWTSGNKYRGNTYQTYDAMVNQLSRMYNGNADWGCEMAKVIVDLRAAFTIAGGVTVKAKKNENADRELEFLRQFIEYNSIEKEVVFDWARESEIEGKFLCRIYPNVEDRKIEARFIPYSCHRYKVNTAPEDYADYVSVTYQLNGTGKEITIPFGQFVYKKFGGRTHLVNETPSKAALLINKIENLDKALWDLRKINNLFASPTPSLKVESQDEADKMWETIHNKNWKIGKMIISTGDFKMNEVGSAAKESLLGEIMMYVKFISGASGIPPHFLGAPDLMSNRSTSNDLFELIEAQVVRERKIWAGGYKELFVDAINMANDNFQAGLDPELVDVEIPQVSEQKLKEIVETWLPLFTAGVIDIDTILEKIPGIDIQKIKENKKAESQAMLDELKAHEKAGQDGGTGDPTSGGNQ